MAAFWHVTRRNGSWHRVKATDAKEALAEVERIQLARVQVQRTKLAEALQIADSPITRIHLIPPVEELVSVHFNIWAD